MQQRHPILQIAIPSPLYRTFDYLPPQDCDHEFISGMRLRIPFGRTTKIGILLATGQKSRIDTPRLKHALEVIDRESLLPPDILDLMAWACRYYHHPPGDVIFSALPTLLRQGHAARLHETKSWRLTEDGARIDPVQLARAPRQAALLELLRTHPQGLDAGKLLHQLPHWRTAMRPLIEKGWAELDEKTVLPAPMTAGKQGPGGNELTPDQGHIVQTVCSALDEFKTFLLEGVTGSGKTEVYMHIIDQVIQANKQALVLVPEIGLTPQLISQFCDYFQVPVSVLHSGLSDRERLDAWLMAKNGLAPIIIGTRSAVFTPLKRLGIIIIDEEHDGSFKQQEGFRYHARQVAIVRAQNAGIPVLLGSATPALESLYNAQQGRYQHLHLSQRVGNASHPVIRLLDVRHQKMQGNLSTRLLEAMTLHLSQNNQVLLFLNRRGYAPTLICHDCGWVARCARCDAHMILHQAKQQLRCHHCAAQRAIATSCPDCNSTDLKPLGHGTERIEEVLKKLFQDTEVLRIDRDSTRRKGTMQSLLKNMAHGHNQILLGTQMLAKGHHLPNVTLVAILDADQGLFGIDFRSSEHLGQLIIQVAGRAGRADKRGEVLIQTHHPDHPLFGALLHHDYHRFAENLLEERRLAQLPPYTHLVLLRAEAVKPDHPMIFLREARALAETLQPSNVQFMGPAPAPMERRAGRYRGHLLIQATGRRELHKLLESWISRIEDLPSAKRVRWSLDVDPIDLM